MAMNSAMLGKALANLVISADAPDDMKTKITKQWQDIADVIIKHIQTNAQVTVAPGIGVTVVPTTGTGSTVTTGSGTIM